MTNLPSLQLLLQRELIERSGKWLSLSNRDDSPVVRGNGWVTDVADELFVGQGNNISVTSATKSAASLGC